jgi:hypothetical protein
MLFKIFEALTSIWKYLQVSSANFLHVKHLLNDIRISSKLTSDCNYIYYIIYKDPPL